ncbi:DsbA family protein [Patescibacteria group bacterium AH-259-L07]|nr:DsbA family protein [Patescibacteria group bacterium AH-259-L07]
MAEEKSSSAKPARPAGGASEDKEQKKEEKKEHKVKKKMSHTRFLGISIIAASVILGGALIYAAQTLSGMIVAQQPENQKETAQETAQGAEQEAGTTKVSLEVSKDDHVRGESNAAVTLVEFSDFQCPFCNRFHPTVTQILDEYPNSVRWVYKHFPLDAIHPQARPAAEASECAAEQNKFWEFGDALFENQSRLGSDYYSEVAGDLGLNVDKFNECVSSRKYKDRVEADYQLGIRLGVRGTPASFINGELLVGAVPYPSLQSAIEKALQNQ